MWWNPNINTTMDKDLLDSLKYLYTTLSKQNRVEDLEVVKKAIDDLAPGSAYSMTELEMREYGGVEEECFAQDFSEIQGDKS